MTTPENSPHEAQLVFQRVTHRIYEGGLVVTLPIDARTIEFMNIYDEYQKDLRNLLGCHDCPILYQDAPEVEEIISPNYNYRKEESGQQSTVDIHCAGHTHRSLIRAGGEQNVPCIKNFSQPQTITY